MDRIIREASRRQDLQATAWLALNGVLAVLFALLLILDEAAAQAGAQSVPL